MHARRAVSERCFGVRAAHLESRASVPTRFAGSRLFTTQLPPPRPALRARCLNGGGQLFNIVPGQVFDRYAGGAGELAFSRFSSSILPNKMLRNAKVWRVRM